MFKLLHCPSIVSIHFNCMVVMHDVPILPFNLFGTSIETHQIEINKKVSYVPRKRKPRIMYWNTRIKTIYPSQLGQKSAQSLNPMHPSMPKVKNTSLCMTASHLWRTCPKLDSDTYIIAIDNCFSYSMLNNMSNFKGDLTPCRGIGGTNQITEWGTVSFVL